MTAPIGPAERSKGELDKKLSDLNNVPLFMQTMPEDPSENPTLAALQSLVHEGSPDGTLRHCGISKPWLKKLRTREEL